MQKSLVSDKIIDLDDHHDISFKDVMSVRRLMAKYPDETLATFRPSRDGTYRVEAQRHYVLCKNERSAIMVAHKFNKSLLELRELTEMVACQKSPTLLERTKQFVREFV